LAGSTQRPKASSNPGVVGDQPVVVDGDRRRETAVHGVVTDLILSGTRVALPIRLHSQVGQPNFGEYAQKADGIRKIPVLRLKRR
jgi:hypothetical protein